MEKNNELEPWRISVLWLLGYGAFALFTLHNLAGETWPESFLSRFLLILCPLPGLLYWLWRTVWELRNNRNGEKPQPAWRIGANTAIYLVTAELMVAANLVDVCAFTGYPPKAIDVLALVAVGILAAGIAICAAKKWRYTKKLNDKTIN